MALFGNIHNVLCKAADMSDSRMKESIFNYSLTLHPNQCASFEINLANISPGDKELSPDNDAAAT